jgi:hypothetical protein
VTSSSTAQSGTQPGWDLETMMQFCNAAGTMLAFCLLCASAMSTSAELRAVLSDREVPHA